MENRIRARVHVYAATRVEHPEAMVATMVERSGHPTQFAGARQRKYPIHFVFTAVGSIG